MTDPSLNFPGLALCLAYRRLSKLLSGLKLNGIQKQLLFNKTVLQNILFIKRTNRCSHSINRGRMKGGVLTICNVIPFAKTQAVRCSCPGQPSLQPPGANFSALRRQSLASGPGKLG